MTQKDKEIFLKDLSSRLPCKTFAQWYHKALNKYRDVKIMEISTYGENIDNYRINVLCQPEPGVDYEASILDIKPYLRPISSMTDKEDKEWQYYKNAIAESCDERLEERISELHDWFNAHYFDYRGLIPMGLALEAPEGMYNIN